jgi:hypothetical protein
VLRFLLGFVAAVVTLAAGAYLYLGGDALRDSCFGRCAETTRCMNARCVASVVPPPTTVDKTGRRRRTRTHLGNDGISAAEPEKKLQPGDERSTTTGDALGRPERLDLSKGDDKELSQADIDRIWAGVEPALSRCVSDAVGDWPLESGKIEVGYRIEQDGGVRKVRVTAPQLLMRNGLYGCMRPKITALRFPASSGASVVTFPFQLQ